MKKIIMFIFLLFSSILLFSCDTNKPEVVIDKVITSNNETKNEYNNILELYNPLDHDIDLFEYSLEIYYNNDNNEPDIINFGHIMIKSHSFITIAHPKFNSSKNPELDNVSNKIDITSELLSFAGGNDPIVLKKNNKIIDIIGKIGFDTSIYKNTSLVRFSDKKIPSKKFDETNYCLYKKECFNLIKTNEAISYNEMLKGPKIDNSKLIIKNYTKPQQAELDELNDIVTVINKGDNGDGKIFKVKPVEYIDGDTTSFNVLPRTALQLTNRVRYCLIDTPEKVSTQKITKEAYGLSASVATKTILKSATSVYLQSIKNKSTKDNFERPFLLVWTDKTLVPFLVVLNGLSEANVTEITSERTNIYYKDIELESWVKMAEGYAKKKKINIHSGKKDRYFNEKTKEFTVTEDKVKITLIDFNTNE